MARDSTPPPKGRFNIAGPKFGGDRLTPMWGLSLRTHEQMRSWNVLEKIPQSDEVCPTTP